MTFRKYRRWCSERECEGNWDEYEAEFCLKLLNRLLKLPFWKRRRAWNRIKRSVEHVYISRHDPKKQASRENENA